MRETERNRKLLRSVLAAALPTALSRILGYIRDLFQAFYLGTGTGADAFTIAFVIPNLLRRLTAEGALTSAFVPVFTQQKKEKTREELWKFANVCFFDLTLLMAILAILGIIFSPLLVKVIAPGFREIPGKSELTIVLTRLMFPYIFVISLSALAMGILNAFHKFVVPAFTPVLLNLAIIGAAVLFAGTSDEPAYVFAGGVLLGGFLQIAFQLPFLRKQGMRWKPSLSLRHPAVRKVGQLMIPGIFGVGVYQINFAISRIMASALEEGSVSALYYASRVEELTLGLFSIALSIVLLPTFSEQVAEQDLPGMKKTLRFSFGLVFLVSLPALAGLLVLSRPIIRVLFERGHFSGQSTAISASCLFYFALGLPFISGVKILAPAFYSLKDTKTPMIIAVIVMLSCIGLSLLLMPPLRAGGIALAISLSQIINLFLLVVYLEKKVGSIGKKDILGSALRSGFCAAVMGAAVWLLARLWESRLMSFAEQAVALLGTIFLGLAVYAATSFFFNRQDLRSVRVAFSPGKIFREKDGK